MLAGAFYAMKSTVLVRFQRGFRVAASPQEAALFVRFSFKSILMVPLAIKPERMAIFFAASLAKHPHASLRQKKKHSIKLNNTRERINLHII